jgi:hypothetical protein
MTRSTVPFDLRMRISPERKAGSASSIVNRLLLKYRLNARRLVHLPAVPEGSDFDRRVRRVAFCSKRGLPVHLNMIEQNNGKALSTTEDSRPRYTSELLLRTRPKIYRQVVRLLGEGWSANKISKWCHVTRETVRAVERREATEISARKKSIIGILGNVAELGASRMEETIGEAGLRDQNRDSCGQDACVDGADAVVADRQHRAANTRRGCEARGNPR